MTGRARDDLGLRRALGDRVLPLLVASMAFLASLAVGGAVGAQALARRWQGGAATALTIQVPRPDERAASGDTTRLTQALALVRADPAVADARALDGAELASLLRPWFGGADAPPGLPLPGVIAAHLDASALAGGAEADLSGLSARLAAAVPETRIEAHDVWMRRLADLAASLTACAWLALAVVAGVAILVIAVATHGGLVARREAIRIIHGLGATDGYIAARFARRATVLAAGGATLGAIAALPVLLALAALAAPFGAGAPAAAAGPAWGLDDSPRRVADALPPALWLTLPGLPAAAAAIGFLTAQGTVRRWLRRLT